MKRLLLLVMLFAVVHGLLSWAPAAVACPGCKEALSNEGEDGPSPGEVEDDPYWNPAYAYSYSVLFMLGVPALLLVAFGTWFYRLSRQAIRNDPPST